MDYLRLIYGKRLSMPGDTDVDAALKQYADEFKTRTASPNGEVTVDKDGHVSIHGIDGVIAVNNTLTKWIFDHNKDKHEFYVEENDPAPWMYPYMEPHGLILKLNKEPVKELDPAVVAQDRQFWNALTKELLSDKHFSDSREARKVFCKLRTAIGGMYVGRHLTTEAEGAFWQALDLDPASSETNFRLVQLYVEQDRFDEAIAVIEQYQSRVGSANQDDRQRLAQAIEQIRELKRQAEEKKPSTNPP
jgi:tetratricopeptide (TPR) repeat protein